MSGSHVSTVVNKKTMKLLLIFCLIFTVCHCKKENLDNLDDVLHDPKLWSLIEKRFGLSDQEKSGPVRNGPPDQQADDKIDNPADEEIDEGDDKLGRPPMKGVKPIDTGTLPDFSSMEDSLGNLCRYHPNNSLIIRSKASLAAGAYFLKSFVGIQQEECVDYCCYTQGCNMAIYENKVMPPFHSWSGENESRCRRHSRNQANENLDNDR